MPPNSDLPPELTAVCPASQPGGASPPKPRSVAFLVSALAGGNLLASALRMAGALLSARAVEPAILGLSNGLALFLGYAPFLQLGILNGLNRELPYYIGKGDHKRVRDLAAAAQAWALLIGLVVAGGAVGVAMFQLLHGNWMLAAGWVTNAVSAWLLFYGQLYLQLTYRTSGDFARLALANVLQHAAGLLLVFLVWWLNFYGICLRSILVGLVQLAFLYHWRPLRLLPAWNRTHLLHLLKIGAPIYGVGQLYAWWATLDGTLVFANLGTEGMGFYALAVMVTSTMQLLPDSLGVVLYPRMAEQYGRGLQIREILAASLKPILAATLAMSLLAVVSWALLPPVVRFLLPRYAGGIQAAQWSLICPALLCLAPVGNIFNVVKRQGLYAVAIALGVISYYLSLRWFLHRSVDLTAFPKAMIIGRGVFVTGCYGCVGYLLRKEAMAAQTA